MVFLWGVLRWWALARDVEVRWLRVWMGFVWGFFVSGEREMVMDFDKEGEK